MISSTLTRWLIVWASSGLSLAICRDHRAKIIGQCLASSEYIHELQDQCFLSGSIVLPSGATAGGLTTGALTTGGATTGGLTTGAVTTGGATTGAATSGWAATTGAVASG